MDVHLLPRIDSDDEPISDARWSQHRWIDITSIADITKGVTRWTVNRLPEPIHDRVVAELAQHSNLTMARRYTEQSVNPRLAAGLKLVQKAIRR